MFYARRLQLCVLVAISVSIVLLRSFGSYPHPINGYVSVPRVGELELPSDYDLPDYRNDFCRQRFDRDYLYRLRDGRQTFSASNTTQSRFDCWSVTGHDNREDYFCRAQDAVLNHSSQTFHVNSPKPESGLTARWPSYLGASGMKSSTDILSFDPIEPDQPSMNDGTPTRMWASNSATPPSYPAHCAISSNQRPYVMIVKREPNCGNFWHGLMEVFSALATLDTLRISHAQTPGQHSSSYSGYNETQIIVTDDHPDTMLWEIWSLLTTRPILRTKDLQRPEIAQTFECPHNIIFPLPGGSNPLWQSDWTDLPCMSSELVHVWRHRIMTAYGIDTTLDNTPVVSGNQPRAPVLRVTIIARAGRRRIVNQGDLFDSLRQQFPRADVNLVDFEGMSIEEQIKYIYDTDILVGAHGAGLTHAMWLKPGRSLVEIQPDRMHGSDEHRGFRGLAKVRGLQYYKMRAHGIGWQSQSRNISYSEYLESQDELKPSADTEWYFWDLCADPARFMRVMTSVIHGAYQLGTGSGSIE